MADDSGQITGDPPGVVMLTGAEPVDESIFVAAGPPGVYKAPFPAWQVWGVVEMDGPQDRYVRVTITEEYLVEKLAPVDVVAKRRKSFFYDEATRTLEVEMSTGVVFDCGQPGVLRPSVTYFSKSFVSSATICGWPLSTFVCSPISFDRSYSCTAGRPPRRSPTRARRRGCGG